LRRQVVDGSIAWSMATGVLIAESLRDEATLQVVSWQLARIERVTVPNVSEEQRAAGLPSTWMLLQIELPDSRAQAIAQALADALMRPGWHAEFNTDVETFTVFSGRVFRYERTDDAARAEAHAYGIAHGVPEAQLVD
jgi:hypothetical protein